MFVGQKVKLNGRTWTIARVGKEVRLEAPRTPRLPAQVMYRHSRTLERVLA